MKQSPDVSVCAVTLRSRYSLFSTMLDHLYSAIDGYSGEVELVIVNNGDAEYLRDLEKLLCEANVSSLVTFQILNSSENNIAIGRNCALENASFEWIAFLDDDEYPSWNWLNALFTTWVESGSPLVAGPTIPVYSANTAKWIKCTDLHNVEHLIEGQKIPFAGSGNCLIHRPSIGNVRFNPELGTAGGEDTDFFLRLTSGPHNLVLTWSKSAVVYETISPDKSTMVSLVKRFLNQGSSFNLIMTRQNRIKNYTVFYIKAFVVGSLSLVIAIPLLIVGSRWSGNWIKRGFSNYGKFLRRDLNFYQ